ncbi:MAG TPA: hypothetical protein PKD90_20350, partial [Phnomibacter sp.]|nr:hypothetical protein [Phnomibacter sp.]
TGGQVYPTAEFFLMGSLSISFPMGHLRPALLGGGPYPRRRPSGLGPALVQAWGAKAWGLAGLSLCWLV